MTKPVKTQHLSILQQKWKHNIINLLRCMKFCSSSLGSMIVSIGKSWKKPKKRMPEAKELPEVIPATLLLMMFWAKRAHISFTGIDKLHLLIQQQAHSDHEWQGGDAEINQCECPNWYYWLKAANHCGQDFQHHVEARCCLEPGEILHASELQ